MNDTMSKIIAMATLAIQQGKSLKISIVDKQDSLSEPKEAEKTQLSLIDKQGIKQAILDNFRNRTDISLKELIDAIKEVDRC